MGALYETTEDGTEVYYSQIHEALDRYINDPDREIDNMRKEPQSRWNAALIYIYNTVFKGTDKLRRKPYDYKANGGMSNNNEYNQELVNCICDYYIALCYEYDKEVSINGFSKLTGIDSDCIYGWAGRESYSGSASATGVAIYKKLSAEREESLSNMLISGKRNPVGLLGALNRHYGWNMGQPKETVHKIQVQSAEQIAAKYGLELPDNESKS